MGEKVKTSLGTIELCEYRWTDPSDNSVETCHAPLACPICRQCSRLDGDREHGHCCGHYGLLPHIWVPGREQDKERTQYEKRRAEIREQRRSVKPSKGSGRR